MKITMFADLSGDVASGFQFPIEIRSSRESSVIQLLFGDPSDKDGPYDPNSPEPRYIALSQFGGADPNGFWAFRWKTVRVEGAGGVTRKEVMLRIKHAVLREEKALSKIQSEVEAFQNMERTSSSRRERLPESVRLFIWQRDEGKCVNCGSKERLEFDHIIPVALGGSNSERNIQLLCERCNREKGKTL